MITFGWNDRRFLSALNELDKVSRRTPYQIVTDQAGRLLRKLAWFTPKYRPGQRAKKSARAKSGRARAGWWAAWNRLRLPGTPYVGNAQLQGSREGDYRDGRRSLFFTFFTMINRVPYIEKLDDEEQIVDRALVGRAKDLERLTDRLFSRQMKRLSR